MAMRIEISRLVAFVRMMRSGLFHQRRRCRVHVPVRIEVARYVTFVRVMRAGLFHGLRWHDFSSRHWRFHTIAVGPAGA